MKHTQSATGRHNNVVHMNPDNQMTGHQVTNLYTQNQIDELFREKIKFMLLVPILLVALVILILVIALFLRVGFIDTQIEAIHNMMNYT